jgi:hypothetical protein
MRSTLHYQYAHRFEEICRRLRESATAKQWDVPLAYWATARDRNLPKALLGLATREVVQSPFPKLSATPGVGIRKLAMLIQLLERALAAARSDSLPAPGLPAGWAPSAPGLPGHEGFDYAAVSESQWSEWCALVKRHRLANEPLGRFAATLRDLPATLWQTPLGAYAGSTLADLRRRKTHGEKRVRVVVETFAAAQSLLGDGSPTHLSVRIVPGFAAPLEAWLLDALQREGFPAAAEVQRAFIDPLFAQLRHDASETACTLAGDFLRAGAAKFNARAAAGELRRTRARVYQLLGEVAAVMSVRWREGTDWVQRLRRKALSAKSDRGKRLFLRAADLFFPRRLAADEASDADSTDRAPRDATENQAKADRWPVRRPGRQAERVRADGSSPATMRYNGDACRRTPALCMARRRKTA